MTATGRLKTEIIEKLEKNFIVTDRFGSYCAYCQTYKPIGAKGKQHSMGCLIRLTGRALSL